MACSALLVSALVVGATGAPAPSLRGSGRAAQGRCCFNGCEDENSCVTGYCASQELCLKPQPDGGCDSSPPYGHGAKPSWCPAAAPQRLQSAAPDQQLLLIIDMQNDYDLSYNMETYGYKKNPWANELVSASQHIKDLIDDVDWDMIVFSQDWLIPVLTDQPSEHEFCLADTPGASPLQELLDAADRKTSNQLRYTKNVDDAFNTISPNSVLAECEPTCSVPEDYPNRCYDSNNTYNGTFLVDVLKGRGFTPSNTKITVVGTEADMCVLTSTLHALQYGFKVDVYEPGLNGGWDGPSDWCEFDVSSPGWEEKAFECQGAAGREEALGYMEAAGARVLWQLPSVSPGPA